MLSPHVVVHAAALALAIRTAYDGDMAIGAVTAVVPSILLIGVGVNPDAIWAVRRAGAKQGAVSAARRPA